MTEKIKEQLIDLERLKLPIEDGLLIHISHQPSPFDWNLKQRMTNTTCYKEICPQMPDQSAIATLQNLPNPFTTIMNIQQIIR